MWDNAQENLALGCRRNCFMPKFGGKGSNAQCSEQGVKEAGHCALGRRDEGTRSAVALAQGDTVKEVSIAYKNKKKKKKKLATTMIMMKKNQCKYKIKKKHGKFIIQANFQEEKLNAICKKNETEYEETREMIKKTFKKSSVQFKRVQIEQKINVFLSNYHKPHIPVAISLK